MDTNTSMRGAAAAVTGARHLRASRNGQDAAAVWVGDRAGAVVVCDGCGSGASSEVGARLGARLVIAALSGRLGAGACAADPALWAGVRAEVTAALAQLAAAMTGGAGERAREQLVHDHLLFTVIAAAVTDDAVAVWALGDGAYALGGEVCVLGPFADNQPPYLGYDLLDAPRPAHLVTAAAAVGHVIVATDGVAELGLDVLGPAGALDRYLDHPDALRRRLALLARTAEHVAWDARRIDRTPAQLQDDGAVALLQWRTA